MFSTGDKFKIACYTYILTFDEILLQSQKDLKICEFAQNDSFTRKLYAYLHYEARKLYKIVMQFCSFLLRICFQKYISYGMFSHTT